MTILKYNKKTPRIGITGQRHDSDVEAKASFQIARFGGFKCDKLFPQQFHQKRGGGTFQGKPDFYVPGADLYIEFKTPKLNSKTSKASADNAMQTALARAGLTESNPHMQLTHGWNHSRHKLTAMQTLLTPQSYIVVFSKEPTLKLCLEYIKAGLVFCTLAALPSYIGYALLRKKGLAASFQLTIEGHTFEIA